MHIFPKAANSTTPSLHLATQNFKYIWLHKFSNSFGYPTHQIYMAIPDYSNSFGYPTIQIQLANQLFKFLGYPAALL